MPPKKSPAASKSKAAPAAAKSKKTAAAAPPASGKSKAKAKAPPATASTPKAAPAPAPAPAASGKVKKSGKDVAPEAMIMKGSGVVDTLSGKVSTCHVLQTNGTVYQCVLNQTNIGANNNKFYVIQVLQEDKDPSQYYLFTRWGRVGVNGQMSTESFRSEAAALSAFRSKFTSKTQNSWDRRADFVKVAGKYQLMDMDYEGQVEEEQKLATDAKSGRKSQRGAGGEDSNEAAAKKSRAEEPPAAAPVSRLPPTVQELMKLIGSKSAMEMTMKELNIDTKRMPLGKISKNQIKSGYEILSKMDKILSGANPSGNLEELSSDFYTLIPHDFGFQRPPLINTKDMVKAKAELLDTLGQLEIATKLLQTEEDKGKKKKEVPKHYLDVTYDSLHCSITPLDKSSEAYRHIMDSIENTHGETHTTYKLRVKDIFVIAREGEKERYLSGSYATKPEKYMLWHGSRCTNYMGILSQGLRIAPKEAPCTGYMFGKGVYFADVVSKSANYCFTSRQQNVGLMLLNEVAVGKPLELTQSKYMEVAQKGFDSTKGIGRMRPGFETVANTPALNLSAAEAKKEKKADAGKETIQWPTKKIEHDTKIQTSLFYSEYIVYDVSQCYMRYLVMTEFVYK